VSDEQRERAFVGEARKGEEGTRASEQQRSWRREEGRGRGEDRRERRERKRQMLILTDGSMTVGREEGVAKTIEEGEVEENAYQRPMVSRKRGKGSETLTLFPWNDAV
jgi:hypothetical protein